MVKARIEIAHRPNVLGHNDKNQDGNRKAKNSDKDREQKIHKAVGHGGFLRLSVIQFVRLNLT